MDSTEARAGISPVRIGIALLALGTAGIHLYLFLIEGFLGNGEMLPIYQLLFVSNVLAYTTLAAALLLSPLARVRSFVRRDVRGRERPCRAVRGRRYRRGRTTGGRYRGRCRHVPGADPVYDLRDHYRE